MDFGRRHKPRSARHNQLENELSRLQAEPDVLKISILSREETLTAVRITTLPKCAWRHSFVVPLFHPSAVGGELATSDEVHR